MAREILFRGISKDYGTFEFGNFIESMGRSYIGNTIGNHPDHWCEVLPETVCQYTGLTDKNGVKIFEGDLIKIHRIHKDFADDVFELKVFQGMFSFWLKEKPTRYCSLGKFFSSAVLKGNFEEDCMKVDGSLFEVIGNIQDNPELIGKEVSNA